MSLLYTDMFDYCCTKMLIGPPMREDKVVKKTDCPSQREPTSLRRSDKKEDTNLLSRESGDRQKPTGDPRGADDDTEGQEDK